MELNSKFSINAHENKKKKKHVKMRE